MIDLHIHALAAIDDGPPDIEAAVDLVRAAAAAGTDEIVATPHVSRDWPNTGATIERALRALRAELESRSIAVALGPGAEIELTYAFELDDAELRRLRLGAGPWMLVEAPHVGTSAPVERMLTALAERGHRIVLAHVERCPAFAADPAMLARLVERGMLASITASSLDGRFGRGPQRAAARFLAGGLIHNVSSDAHDVRTRAPGVLAALERAGLGTQAPWLTHAVPDAIVRGAPIPPPPAWGPVQVRGGLRWRLRGR